MRLLWAVRAQLVKGLYALAAVHRIPLLGAEGFKGVCLDDSEAPAAHFDKRGPAAANKVALAGEIRAPTWTSPHGALPATALRLNATCQTLIKHTTATRLRFGNQCRQGQVQRPAWHGCPRWADDLAFGYADWVKRFAFRRRWIFCVQSVRHFQSL